MSVAAAKKLRIVAIPLARPRAILKASASSSKVNNLTYYQFQISNKKASKPPPPATSKEASIGFKWPEEGIIPWATRKAIDTWAGFGKAEGGWRLKVHQTGEKLMDRLDFEEVALRSIDPSLAPSITHVGKNAVEEQAKEQEPLKIPLYFPPSVLSSSAVLSELRAYTEHRIPKHKRGFYFWMLITPITFPLKLIPIIPNLPFFFCVWRSWSHYRAYKSSQYLQSLLDHEIIVPEASESLDELYKASRITNSSSSTTSVSSASESNSSSSSLSSTLEQASKPKPQPSMTPEPESNLLVTEDAVPKILDFLGSTPGSTAAVDLYRAIQQAKVRLRSL